MSVEGFTRTRGEKLGSYVLEEPIGRGGFSEVWRAKDATGFSVALKIVVHPEHAAQLRSEAKALAHVSGPGIVPVLAVEAEHDPPFIVLLLLLGGDLRQHMRRGSLDPVEAVALFERVLSVIARVHREGVVHGDLKPENVLFDVDGSLHVGDFGLSRRIAQRSASLSVSASLEDARLAGTLDYMAPEQRAGEKPTPRSDVYALGVMLYELITGERPQGIFKMPSERDPTLPPVIDRALASSLAPDPEQRFASAGALLAFVRAGLGSDWQALAVARRRIEPLLQSTTPERSRDRFVVSSLASALIPLLVIIVVAQEHDRERWETTLAVVSLGLGIGASALARRLFERAREARRLALEKFRDRIDQQIKAETRWTVVREARQAAALAPASTGVVALSVGFVLGFLFVWAVLGVAAAFAIAMATWIALFAAHRWNRDTPYRRKLRIRRD